MAPMSNTHKIAKIHEAANAIGSVVRSEKFVIDLQLKGLSKEKNTLISTPAGTALERMVVLESVINAKIDAIISNLKDISSNLNINPGALSTGSTMNLSGSGWSDISLIDNSSYNSSYDSSDGNAFLAIRSPQAINALAGVNTSSGVLPISGATPPSAKRSTLPPARSRSTSTDSSKTVKTGTGKNDKKVWDPRTYKCKNIPKSGERRQLLRDKSYEVLDIYFDKVGAEGTIDEEDADFAWAVYYLACSFNESAETIVNSLGDSSRAIPNGAITNIQSYKSKITSQA